MSTHNLCFEQKYEKYQNFLSENFQFLEVKFSIHLNRCVFVMHTFYINGVWSSLLFPRLSREKTHYTINQWLTTEVLDMTLISTTEHQY